MNAIEFDAVVEDGLIHVPDIYKNKLGRRITVMIMNREQTGISPDEMFPPVADTKAWNFKREEANER